MIIEEINTTVITINDAYSSYICEVSNNNLQLAIGTD